MRYYKLHGLPIETVIGYKDVESNQARFNPSVSN